jgi:hypothetical protein
MQEKRGHTTASTRLCLLDIMPMLIQEYPGAVPPDLCARYIERFERDPERKPSAVVVDGRAQLHHVRSGTQLFITRQDPEWEDLFMAIVPALRATIDSYLLKNPGLADLVECEGLDCTLPMIERVDPGQGFTWHYDNTLATTNRVLAGLLYLKTVTEGGETEFHDGTTICAEAGKIVLFPPYWTHFHRGISPVRESKYVLSYFWIYPPK